MEVPQQPRRTLSFARLIMPVLWIAVGVTVGFLIPRKDAEIGAANSGESSQVAGSLTASTTSENSRASLGPSRSALDRLRAACTTDSFGLTDPAEALAAIQQLTFSEMHPALALIRSVRGDERRTLFDTLAKRWAMFDANDAFGNALRERRDHDWRDRLGRAAGEALAAADPKAALALITATRPGDQRRLAARWILVPFAKLDPAGAADYFLSDQSLANDDVALNAIAREFSKISPQDAFAWVEKIPGLRPRQHATKMVWVGWADANPLAAAAALKSTSRLDGDIFESVGHAWSRTDPAAALAWAQSIADENSRERALRSIYLDVEKLGAEKARSLVDSITDERARGDAASRVADQLARTGEVSEALAWAQSLSAPEARARAVSQVVHEWAEIDPAAATRFAAGMPEGKNRSDLFAQAFAHWARNEPDEAFAYGQQLPPGKDRDTATARAIDAMRDNDPQKALQWFQQIEDPKVAQRAAQGLLGSLVRVDQEAAFRVASDLPPEAQAEAYHGIVRGWAFDYPKEAGNWVNSLPPGQARDTAVKAYVSVIDGMDAGAATQWAYSIQDPTMRMEATMDTFQRWLGSDHSAAAEWLQNTDLPEGLRPFFERELKNRQAGFE
jgi:hypothetical protein